MSRDIKITQLMPGLHLVEDPDCIIDNAIKQTLVEEEKERRVDPMSFPMINHLYRQQLEREFYARLLSV